jgi:hypothetical protein
MSKITTVYDYVVSSMATLFPSKTIIPNAYSIQDNSDNFLRDGYGVKTQGHFVAKDDVNFIVQEYNFRLLFCREVIRLDSDTTVFNTETKAIEEDVFSARSFFYDIDLNGSPGNIDQMFLGATDPIAFLQSDKNNFIFVETSLLIRIREQVVNC